MEVINAPAKVDFYLKQHGIEEYFSCDPVFTLCRYAQGELLASPFTKSRFLQFVVEGSITLYGMPEEETVTGIETPSYRAAVIGEAELFDPDFPTSFVEARTEVYTLALPLEAYRERLMNDKLFLRFCYRTFTQKLSHATAPEQALPLREQMMKYIGKADPEEPIRDLTHLAFLFHTSTRQLSRVIRTLCEEGVLERSRKGVYRIRKQDLS